MKEDISITVIVPRHDYLQILTHGSHYTCPTKLVDGESYFKFKGTWHRTRDYTDKYTMINNI